MNILINGKQESINEGLSVKNLLEERKINPNAVACELNLRVLRRAELGSVLLKEGDTLEVIRMIGGG